jgi:hypothetical protein
LFDFRFSLPVVCFAGRGVDAPRLITFVRFVLWQIIYWGIYAQMSTTFFNQGCQMNLSVGVGH